MKFAGTMFRNFKKKFLKFITPNVICLLKDEGEIFFKFEIFFLNEICLERCFEILKKFEIFSSNEICLERCFEI